MQHVPHRCEEDSQIDCSLLINHICIIFCLVWSLSFSTTTTTTTDTTFFLYYGGVFMAVASCLLNISTQILDHLDRKREIQQAQVSFIYCFVTVVWNAYIVFSFSYGWWLCVQQQQQQHDNKELEIRNATLDMACLLSICSSCFQIVHIFYKYYNT